MVGETAVIEDDVSILQGVTLGGTGKETGDRHPKIRHGVLIGAGAKILGNIEIGHCARVAAGSVVLSPVPHNKTVAGVPARIVGEAGCAEPARDMNQILADKASRASEIAGRSRRACRRRAFRGKGCAPSQQDGARDGQGRNCQVARASAPLVRLRRHQRRAAFPAEATRPTSRSASAVGEIVVDDEDGDRSFFFEMKIPVERAALQDFLRKLFGNDKLTDRRRA